MDGIASAVVLPESEETEYLQHSASPIGAQKRRQSSIVEQDVKRQRLNSIDANIHPDRQGSIDGKAPAPVTGRRERGRERRLFGAALGALSQNSATTAQRKRSEIEKRQKARRELEEQESDQRKLEREVQRRAQRQKEQKRFELDSMHTRHANLRHMAHFLQTDAEPRLYYKPWETNDDENDRIQDHIADAEDLIRRELQEYETRHQEDGERARHVSRDADAERDAGAPLTGKEHIADAPQQQPPANGATNDSGPSPKDPEQREDHAESFANEAVSGVQAAEAEQRDVLTSHEATADDEASNDVLEENGEEVVEAAEDTVIY